MIEWDEVPLATGYKVERKQEAIQQGWLSVANVQETQTTYKDGGLDADTTYFYRVSAMTDDGAAPPSDVVSATTPIAVPPATDVTAVATLDTITLSWTDVTDETGYRVERSLDGVSDWIEIATTGQGVTTYVNGTLSAGTTYYYRIVATNAGGDSTAFERRLRDDRDIPVGHRRDSIPSPKRRSRAAPWARTRRPRTRSWRPRQRQPSEVSTSVEGDLVAVEGVESTAPAP